jgi:O-antigen/teichoic acid export membrane protein
VFTRLKALGGNLVVYGIGDAATQIISFFLLPIYVRYLSPADYGVLALLLTVEVAAKVIFRWGIDASFMRLYFDCPDLTARRLLASTQFYFLTAANGTLLAMAVVLSPAIGRYLFHTNQYDGTLRLVLINTFVTCFYFLPYHVMRIEGRTSTYITLGFLRSGGTLLARLLLVIGLGRGVHGVVLADVAVTALFTLTLLPWFGRLIRPVFSRQLLRESLRFGLPRLPHGVAHQVVAVSDRYVLGRFVSLHELGLYSTGASFALGLKLFLSSFESAWAPFYFGVMREPDAKDTFSRVTTYGVLILALLTAGLTACARDVIALATTPTFQQAARVIPWIALGVAFQGVYLLTSIGLNITKHTEYYPMATGIAAATSVTANLLLVPSFGIVGAAWANMLAYGVLAFVSWHFSQRFFPMKYESRRLARIVIAAFSGVVIAHFAVPATKPVAGLLLHGTTAAGVFFGVLAWSGFFVPNEVARLAAVFSRVRRRKVIEQPVESAELAGEMVAAPTTDDAELVDESPEADVRSTAAR